MTYLNIETVENDAMRHMEKVIGSPRVMYMGAHRFRIQGVWKSHAPYQITLDFELDKLGGVAVSASILPYFALYNRSEHTVVTSQVRYDDSSTDWSLEIHKTTKFLVRKLAAYAQLTVNPPKRQDREALIEWTVKNSELLHAGQVRDHFSRIGI